MHDGTTTTTLTPATMIERYIELRDRKKRVLETHKQELAQYNDALARLEGWLLDALNAAGVENMRARSGTVYKEVATSATVRDWPATLAYIQQTSAWDLLEARVSKTAVLAVIEDTGAPIPGVSVTQATVLHVRRAG